MKKLYIAILAGAMIIGSCTDLDVTPRSSSTADVLLTELEGYRNFLAKLYAGLSVSGQQGQGGAGNGDIAGIDEGFSQYLRQLWMAQELSTDEAVTAWGDEGIQDYHAHNWLPSNQFITALYDRIFFQVSQANEFLRESTDEKLNSRGFSAVDQEVIRGYRAEARFLRAYSLWHGIDLYGDIPFLTDQDAVTSEPPDQASRADVFNYIESELQALETLLPEPRGNEYGRVDRAAAWALLAKLYLNAEVYTGTPRYGDCITYCNRIITSGAYSLDGRFQNLFLADNHTANEIIFPITFDGINTLSFGGMNFLMHMTIGGSMNAADYGMDGGWSGMRTTSAVVDLFPDDQGNADKRAIFWTDGQNKEITDLTVFTDGYPVPKFQNITSTGAPGQDDAFPDTDFPVFRLADVYLMYAESALRGGTGGDLNTALGYVNQIRERAYENTTGNITGGELDLDFIIDERARELMWETHRRTDLIRFNLFSENGIWPFKGCPNDINCAAGQVTDSFRDLYPIPSSDLIANTKLEQNPGYGQ